MTAKEITVDLSSPLKYTGATGPTEATFVTLIEPMGKVSHICCELESLIQSAVMKMADLVKGLEAESTPKADGPHEVADAESTLALMNSAGVDMSRVVLHCRELFKTTVLMGGEKPITTPRLDDLSHADMRKLVGTYIGAFVLS
jgi:hypothetical protein